MRNQFRAGDEPQTSRREYWQHVAGQAIGALELRVAGDIDPADQIVAGTVGAVRIGELISHEPGGAVRTAAHVRRAASELYKIDIPVDGGGLVEQDGRQAALRGGDFALVDLSRPARWAMAPRRVIAVVFPMELLPLRPAQARQLTALAIPGDHASGALVSSLAARMVGHLGEFGPAESARLGGAMLDLIGSALSSRLDGAMPAAARDRALALRVAAYIEEHLRDPGLSPPAIAAAHHLSLRALHRLYEDQDTSVAAWIRRRRLERCRRDLLDPALRSRPVGAIGARWGMSSPSQFNRAFRAAYGVPPAHFRDEFGPPASSPPVDEPPRPPAEEPPAG
jgi:AraC-like DNA-binding protein